MLVASTVLPVGIARAASLFELARDGEPAEPVVAEAATEAETGAAGAEVPAVSVAPSGVRLRVVDNGLAVDALVDPAATAGTVEQLLSALGYKVAPEDVVYPALAAPAPSFGALFIQRAPDVVVLHDGETARVKSRASTVGALLTEKGITLDKDDRSEPGVDAPVVPNLTVRVVRVSTKEVKEKEAIDYESSTKDDAGIFEGETKVVTAGKAGEKEFTYKLTIEDGREVKREKVGEKVLSEPVAEVLARGTKPRPKTAETGPYKDLINAAAAEYGVDGAEMMRVMLCESGGNPKSAAYDSNGKLLYAGLFQYAPDFWNSSWNPYRSAGIWDAGSQIKATALAWSKGWRGRWGC